MRSILNPRATHRNRPITIKMPYIFYKKTKISKKNSPIKNNPVFSPLYRAKSRYTGLIVDFHFFLFVLTPQVIVHYMSVVL